MAQYSNPYYDPEKAHEYYETHKKLKGYENRYGGHRGDGTSAASGGVFYEQPSNPKTIASDTNANSENRVSYRQPTSTDDEIEQVRSTTSSTIKSIRNEIYAKQDSLKEYTTSLSDANKQLRAELKSMSKAERKANRKQYAEEIKANIALAKKAREESRAYIKELREKIWEARRAQREKLFELRDKKHQEQISKREKKFEEQEYEHQNKVQERLSKADAAEAEYKSKRAESDKAQSERENAEDGRTGGFNEKGKQAAKHLREKIAAEKKETIERLNKQLDDKMSNRVAAIRRQIENNPNLNKELYLSKARSLLGDLKKEKSKMIKSAQKEFKNKYTREINSLKKDKSNWSYYDRKTEQDARHKERLENRSKRWAESDSAYATRRASTRARYDEADRKYQKQRETTRQRYDEADQEHYARKARQG